MKVFAIASIPQGVTIGADTTTFAKRGARYAEALPRRQDRAVLVSREGRADISHECRIGRGGKGRIGYAATSGSEANDIRADAGNDSGSVQTSAPGQVSGANLSAARRA